MNLSEIRERVEGATGPDREIDREIVIWLHPILIVCPREGDGWHHPEYGRIRGPEPYTASTDAALGLIERVLPEFKWQVQGFPNFDPEDRFNASLSHAGFCFRKFAPTAPLALLRALLAALEAQPNPTGAA